jgi:hypothetical protein
MVPAKSPTSLPDALDRLRFFNEKTEKLLRCSFVEKVFGKDRGITIHFGEDQKVVAERQGADEESTDALTLTLRFFFQERDNIAIYDKPGSKSQMLKFYESLPIPDDKKQRARETFVRFDQYLATTSHMSFMGRSLTNWNIVETVLYGDKAHANHDKRPIFQEWQEAAPFGTFVQSSYEEAVAEVIRFVDWCVSFNKELIGRLGP